MTNQTQIDKAIRILVDINDIISEKRFYHKGFPYANLLNDFRTVDHWRAYFTAQNNNLVAIDLILQIPELAGFFRDGWGTRIVWDFDNTYPENLFYIDLITACPMLAKYGWYHDQPVEPYSVTSGVRAMIKRLFETKDGFSFMAELTKMVNLTTADAFKIAYLVDCLLVDQTIDLKTEPVSNQAVQPKVCEPKKTRSGKVY